MENNNIIIFSKCKNWYLVWFESNKISWNYFVCCWNQNT